MFNLGTSNLSLEFKDILHILPFVKITKGLKHTHTTSISIANNEFFYRGIELRGLISAIKEQLNDNIYKEILKEIYMSDEQLFCDLINLPVNDDSARYIISNILYNFESNHKCIITNYITAEEFLFNRINIIHSSSTYRGGIKECGKLMSHPVYLNDLSNYNDDTICLLGDVFLDYDTKIKLLPNNDTLSITIDFGFKINHSKLLYLIRNRESDGYYLMKRNIRNEKIDKILN